ncbi:DUF2924 domain-containing protein [Brevundimonas sp. KM4]|uniref:DUF2924 domain-containing protein n=1 Tax=Brevundimonas sp. KM4 TaxID=1628191 RepID=UPI0005F89610|nr:DUF2924 domain-containing protein [Brevundimonas sp. KM4]KJV38145.1 hypothetical protein VH88_14845 [Brevundimonas sp. KM4]
MTGADSLSQELVRLETLPLQELRIVWRQVFKAPAPSLRSPELLRRIIGWRLQVDAGAGLKTATKRAIASKARIRTAGPALTPGVRITREWQGRSHHVEVLTAGFLYDGRTFDSLSEIAREITGVRWNGPRFFGLRKGSGK